MLFDKKVVGLGCGKSDNESVSDRIGGAGEQVAYKSPLDRACVETGECGIALLVENGGPKPPGD